ncbi:MAG TPA: trypsin-like peptidase domain-containing protein [Blastocatellia bacterium]|nr:trypsin-like peptidase domain-containing protein [Blastocatellia bacterium]
MRAVLIHIIGPDKGKRERFDASRITIGRASDNALCFNDGQRRVSSHHAEIVRNDDHYLLHDLGSTNGTMINGRRVVTSEIQHDDLIEFGAGGPLLRFIIEPDETDSPEAQKDLQSQSLRRNTTDSLVRPPSHKANGLLLVAIAAAMLIGAVGVIFLSSRLPAKYNEERNFTEVAELNRPAVIFIRVEFELLDEIGQVIDTVARTGSGFLVSSNGLIVTNRHLVRDWEYNSASQNLTGRTTKVEVILPGQTREQAILADIHRINPDKDSPDVAILKINLSRLRFVRGIESDLNNIEQGQDVAVIGYPLGLDLLKQTHDEQIGPSLSTGIVSRVGQDYIQLNLRAYHGNSGGPALNRKGEVIGILTANVSSAQDIALCTPISAALELINQPTNLSVEVINQEGIHHGK